MNIRFKDDINPIDLKSLTLNCWVLLKAVSDYCHNRNLPFMVTSLISDRQNVKSVSTTHETGRAFDMSLKGLPSEEVGKLVQWANKNYKNIAAISKSTMLPTAAVYGDNKHLDHIHFQVRS